MGRGRKGERERRGGGGQKIAIVTCRVKRSLILYISESFLKQD